ncbi:MAG: hypothetical protein RLZZ416_61 [Candidatus Parcubacteria bacterium]|jgi:hypothetical protein
MKKSTKIIIFRALTVPLSVALVVGPIAPAFADDATTPVRTTDEERLGMRDADTMPPTIAPHADVQAAATSDQGAAVTYVSPATTDNIDAPGVATCAPPSGSSFPVGFTTVTCTAADAAGNAAAPVTFTVSVSAYVPPPLPATTTPPTGSGQTPDTSGATSTSTPPGAADPAHIDPSTASSTASTSSGYVPPAESDTDNTDFQDIVSGNLEPPCNLSAPGCLQDISATSTEALALDPKFTVASSTDGTGNKTGSSIFTGSAVASTTARNILNITRSNIDGPGQTNSSMLTAHTDNGGDVTTTDDTRAFTGENKGQGGEGDAAIHTGSAVSSARVLNVVNTNFFNSNGLVLFLNPQNGDSLDLRTYDLSYFLRPGVGASPTALGCTILTCLNSANLQVLNKNDAEVNNNVLVRASTGLNAATTTKQGNIDIQTGNAYASAAVLNMVNTNFVNSKYLVANFDNFGDMQGDIVLPDAVFFSKLFQNGNTLPEMNSSSFIVDNDNNETFVGTTTAHAITGMNLAVASSTGSGQDSEGHGDVQTGQAHTSSTSYTAANRTHVGGSSALFVFHVSGSWSGTVKGLPEGMSWRRTAYGIEVYSNGSVASALAEQGIYNSSDFIASSTNKAIVHTDVDVWAETGNNAGSAEDGTASIRTGDAYATANVVNMVNTNVVNRNFIFAVFNITGDWQGDIDFGGHSPNLQVTTTVDQPNPTVSGSEITYHFLVKNIGDVEATGVSLAATYNKNVLSFSRSNARSTDTTGGTNWEVGRVGAGGSLQIDATARVSAQSLQSGFMLVPLNAMVTGIERDQDITDNSQKTTITVSAPAAGSGSSGGGSSEGNNDRRGSDPPSGGGGSSSGSGSSSGAGSGAGSTSGGGGSAGSDAGNSGAGSNGAGAGGATGSNNSSGSGGEGANGANSNSGANANANSGGAGGSGAGGGGAGGAGFGASPFSIGAPGLRTAEPQIMIKKTASAATSTAPSGIDYKVVIENLKTAGPAYSGLLTDTLYDPKGKVMYTRSWDLDVVAPGDQITLTYTVAFGTSTVPGLYHNVAAVTGLMNYEKLPYANPMPGVFSSSSVEFLPSGKVLGEATTTVSTITNASLTRTTSCGPYFGSAIKVDSKSGAADIKKLQTFLNAQGAKLPATGYFGPMTIAAVKLFQLKYRDDILKPVGLTYPTGSVFSSTMRKINSLACAMGIAPQADVSTLIKAISADTIPALKGARNAAAVIPAEVSPKTRPAEPKEPSKPKPAAKKTQPSAVKNVIGGITSKFRW